jgi:ribonuclease D
VATGTDDPAEPTITPLTVPADGVPDVIADPHALLIAADQLAQGQGPIAIDAERASGYRYGQRAYLVQLRRAGTGTLLIDPTTTGPLDVLVEPLTSDEWILHAASQDLPCLAELGLRPTSLFDTELAGRIAGFPRVGLGPLVERMLGLALEKGHGAADWSTRPLPEPWLRYAALDVEVLLELRAALIDELEAQGKLDWALEEFAAIVAAPPATPRAEPWRRTSGLHRIRKPRLLATVRELWTERDLIAQERDLSPGRVLPDAAIVEAAQSDPKDLEGLLALPGFKGRGARRYDTRWWRAIERARALPSDELPTAAAAVEGPPPPRTWPDRDPAAAARLSAARAALSALSEAQAVPVENLLSPDLVRRLCWEPPETIDASGVRARLEAGRARQWQIALTLPLLVDALSSEPGQPAAAE